MLLLAQITASEIQDYATTGLPISPLHLVVVVVLLYVFRERIGDFFAGLRKPKAAGTATAEAAEPAPAATTTTEVRKPRVGPEYVHKTLITAGIAPEKVAEFVKEHYDTIMANQKG